MAADHMEIVVPRDTLATELRLLAGIAAAKQSIPILSNVLIEASAGRIQLAATDLDVALRCSCAGEVVTKGSITLSAKKVFDIVRSLPAGDVRLKVEKDAWAVIAAGQVSFKLAGLPREDFPELPKAEAPAAAVQLPAEILRDLIARVSFAITTEDARYYLAGALLVLDTDGVAMVATDGHRLSYARRALALGIKEPQRVLVPRKAIEEVAALMDGEDAVTFAPTPSHLVFHLGQRTLTAKTIEGQFPAFEKVIAVKGDKTVVVKREALATAIRRVGLVSPDRTRCVSLSLKPGALELLASSPDLGEAHESLPVDYSGAAIAVGFNGQYLLDFLKVAGAERVVVELKDPESQGVLRPELSPADPDHRYVVMPMRL